MEGVLLHFISFRMLQLVLYLRYAAVLDSKNVNK